MAAIFHSTIPGLTPPQRGKVRDIYELDAQHLLIVATDRISAFDVILPTTIPGKGEVLTQVSHCWFRRLAALVPNHLSDVPLAAYLSDASLCAELAPRSMVVRKLKPLPIEAVVRGYLIGSGWKDYQRSGSVCGISLPQGLPLAAQLPQPLYTPSTKAAIGAKDENIDFAATVTLIGTRIAEEVRTLSLALYQQAAAFALTRGIIIADTKFEFGLDPQGKVVLIDEVLTPDSSRFWLADAYRVGENPPSFDKQFVRDYLETLTWNKRPPAPELPAEIVAKTAAKYREAQSRLCD
jgi:phosphoribosylaminoimidazole-succinocarboxamide synthase